MARVSRKPNPQDILRRRKKKVSILTQEQIDYVDWKDINLLRRFMSDRAKIRARLITGNNQQQQTEIARAIKNAREMALLPYTNRITTQRSTTRSHGEDGHNEGPVPQPSEPPPGMQMTDDVDPTNEAPNAEPTTTEPSEAIADHAEPTKEAVE
ncbi:MAG: 30S ribosomal protein S18 [Acidimicrobiia bacterium]|nr:30S ribosomal protein S18 [Acidimicrobiia bacterium]